jgi:hypothetical protein
MIWQHSSKLVSGLTVTAGLVMQSLAIISKGVLPFSERSANDVSVRDHSNGLHLFLLSTIRMLPLGFPNHRDAFDISEMLRVEFDTRVVYLLGQAAHAPAPVRLLRP